jgi:hypothetical protein
MLGKPLAMGFTLQNINVYIFDNKVHLVFYGSYNPQARRFPTNRVGLN